MPLKIIIIGGVAGGASAAAKARRTDEHAFIQIVERGPYVSFANCGLPYYIGNDIKNRKDLLLQTPESFWKRFKVHVKTFHEATKIDREKKQIEIKNLKTNEITIESYDKLILAPGAGAIVPPLPGIKSNNIFTLKTVPESDAIKNYIEQNKPKRAVIIGAGFIGLESAEALIHRGMDVSLIEMAQQILPPFDADIAQLMYQHLIESGLKINLNDGVKAFHGTPMATEVELQSGKRISMDMAILSIGVRPELQLAQNAGLVIGKSGGIEVNEYQQTSDPDIYAAGDAVEIRHLVTKNKTRIPLAGPANKQGRVAGANAAGEKLIFPGAMGTAIVECLGISAAKTGLSEKEAQKEGLNFSVSLTHSLDHAGYYPGAELLHIKLISEKNTGKLLGAQVVGENGVDKRIDVLATALSAEMKVTDLENLDLAYAPQFSSAKDPVIIAGFAASNVLRNTVNTLTCAELQEKMNKKENLQIVDVRTVQEYELGHLDQAILIPVDELRERMCELNPDIETILYCKVGLRGYLAARIMEQNGFKNIKNLTGGLLTCPTPSPTLLTSINTQHQMNVDHLFDQYKKTNAWIWDVREPDEYAFEHIENTTNIPLGKISERFHEIAKDQIIYVLCQSGIRSEQAVQQLSSAGYKSILVQGGLTAWKAKNYPIQKSNGPIPIMRQVQIIAGSLALIGGLFSNLFWISIMVGAGLIFAGMSGTCGMAFILMKMPWNKTTNCKNNNKNNCSPCGS